VFSDINFLIRLKIILPIFKIGLQMMYWTFR